MNMLWMLLMPPLIPAAAPPAPLPTAPQAVARARVLLHRSGDTWRSRRTCFACHHHTLQVFAEAETARAGFGHDAKRVEAHAEHAHLYFAERQDDLSEGKRLPGGPYSAAYGLWTLHQAQTPADDTTTAMVAYLLQVQEGDGTWFTTCTRPPIQGSRIASTVLSLAMMRHFGTPEQQPAIEKAAEKAKRWLADAKGSSTEDQAWRIWGLHTLKGDAKALARARDALLQLQRDDGGWAPTPDLPSDAFATAQGIYMLRLTGTPASNPALQRGMAWLLRTQGIDGSWRVETRVKPVQPKYDNGDPHGKHQFVSIAATAWACAALSRMNK
jgi:hypothetical protein